MEHQCHLFPSHTGKHLHDLVDSWGSILQRPIKKEAKSNYSESYPQCAQRGFQNPVAFTIM